jgi:hypothetical protein
VRPTDQLLAPHGADGARILAVVAVVAEHEVLARRHGDLGKGAPCAQAGQELHRMRAAVQRLGRADRVHHPARRDGLAARLRAAIGQRLAVQDQHVAVHRDAVARQTDDALDEARAAGR